ncbi:ImmA/IrrE family metallo-endopeptidase [Streptomyces sp. AC555_RSS877]|uniref:ImmA/IrrE family metallo-endopeptidase n=1 Tax=Streptomyces sp. AC555_RSS877 TaxID=2823688 RepID=UPI0020B852AE|nr:ImmA/IrrE family metallo-endopeptidase [Streptomyces sp. AC555_RSS877]
MVHLLQSHGVRVFSLSPDSLEVDAFAVWRGTTPFVFLNTMETVERSTFDAAHELGHLVMHATRERPAPEAERQANDFTSAFPPKARRPALRPGTAPVPLPGAAGLGPGRSGVGGVRRWWRGR